jgi:hypothetical protein
MAHLNTACPQCSAPHARKLSVIHTEGLSTVQANVNTVGKLNTVGGQKIKTTGTINGTQQTQASKDAAPPIVPKVVTVGAWIQGLLIAVSIVIIIGGIINFMMPLAVCGAVMLVASFAVPTKSTEAEQRRHDEKTAHLQAAKDVWEKTFQCGSCGNRFVPVEVKAA